MLALAACGAGPASHDRVQLVTCDPVANAREADDAVRLLGAGAYTVGGWNHASTASGGLSLPVTEYRVSGDHDQPDATCNGERTLDLVLVKRLVDWYDQHVNGVEATFRGEDVHFGDVTDISIELRLRPERTVLPTTEDVATRLAGVLTPEQLTELDSGLVNLELTLFGDGASGDRPFLNAGAFIELDPAELADYADLLVAGLRINPESDGGRTVRHWLLDDFVPGEIPEIFKEMGLTISLIEVGHEQRAP